MSTEILGWVPTVVMFYIIMGIIGSLIGLMMVISFDDDPGSNEGLTLIMFCGILWPLLFLLIGFSIVLAVIQTIMEKRHERT